MVETEQDKLENLMARDGRAYIVRDHAQLATAISRLKALISSIEHYTSRHVLTPAETERYALAIGLLRERIERAEAIDLWRAAGRDLTLSAVRVGARGALPRAGCS